MLAMPAEERQRRAAEIAARMAAFPALGTLIRDTIARTDADVEKAAELLHLAPSIHILGTRMAAVAKEGALKIREVVLNHTEGFEASEFKHGPNTILGFNTVFGPEQVGALLSSVGAAIDELLRKAAADGLDSETTRRLVRDAAASVLAPTCAKERVLDGRKLHGQLAADYPLLYVTGPDPRDVALTVSQINTHKIRGAVSILIAEEHPALRQAVGKPPANNPGYRSAYITLPPTGDPLLASFAAVVVLQRLALKMSLKKARYLDDLGIPDHGVHPDVPKNASKSITVD